MMRRPFIAWIAAPAALALLSACAPTAMENDGIAIVGDPRAANIAHAVQPTPIPVAPERAGPATAAAIAALAASVACGPAFFACAQILPPLSAAAVIGPAPERKADPEAPARIERLRTEAAVATSTRLAALVAEEAAPRWRLVAAPAATTLVMRIDEVALEDRGMNLHAIIRGTVQLRRGAPGQGLDQSPLVFVTQGWLTPLREPGDEEAFARDLDRLLRELARDLVRQMSRSRHLQPFLR